MQRGEEERERERGRGRERMMTYRLHIAEEIRHFMSQNKYVEPV